MSRNRWGWFDRSAGRYLPFRSNNIKQKQFISIARTPGDLITIQWCSICRIHFPPGYGRGNKGRKTPYWYGFPRRDAVSYPWQDHRSNPDMSPATKKYRTASVHIPTQFHFALTFYTNFTPQCSARIYSSPNILRRSEIPPILFSLLKKYIVFYLVWIEKNSFHAKLPAQTCIILYN